MPQSSKKKDKSKREGERGREEVASQLVNSKLIQ